MSRDVVASPASLREETNNWLGSRRASPPRLNDSLVTLSHLRSPLHDPTAELVARVAPSELPGLGIEPCYATGA
jgi:hypothetical protein